MSIIFENVSHIYMPGTPYQQTAIENICLEIAKGEFVGIIGHTGSGKSTLVQHMNALLAPSNGKVLLDGVDVNQKNPTARAARRRVGMVFQYPEHQLFEETVYADIAFGPRNLQLPDEEIDRRVRQAMVFVGLDFAAYRERSPFHLSGGQMRRVAIAGVIALEPDYLILDEPSAGLDPRGRDEIFGQIMELYRSTGITVVLVSHNMEDVARMAGRVIVMDHGSISMDGVPRDIFRYGQEKLVAAGVDVPPLTTLLTRMQQNGLEVDVTAATAEEAAASIQAAIGRRKTC